MLKMGGSRTQANAHKYVLDEITGLGKARQQSIRLTRLGLGVASSVALAILIIAYLGSKPIDDAIWLSFGLLLAALPFANIALTYTTGLSLRRRNLRLNHLFI